MLSFPASTSRRLTLDGSLEFLLDGAYLSEEGRNLDKKCVEFTTDRNDRSQFSIKIQLKSVNYVKLVAIQNTLGDNAGQSTIFFSTRKTVQV